MHGKRPLTGEEVRDGFENLDITEARLAELGLTGFMPPIKVTCADHEGAHAVRVQQWDGEKWALVTDWITPMTDVVRPMIEAWPRPTPRRTASSPRLRQLSGRARCGR